MIYAPKGNVELNLPEKNAMSWDRKVILLQGQKISHSKINRLRAGLTTIAAGEGREALILLTKP